MAMQVLVWRECRLKVCALFALVDNIANRPHWRTHDFVLRLSVALLTLIHASHRV